MSTLTLAQRARTAVAACDTVRWPSDHEPVAVPFVEQAGSLLLIVTDEQRQDLLDIGSGCVALNAPAIASVRLSGDFWPVAGNTAEDILTEIRACHRECLDCPTRRLSRLVGFQVDLVELEVGTGFRGVDLNAYVTAQPDWVLALGIQVRAHLNATHAEDVLEAACALVGQRADQVISVAVTARQRWGTAVAIEVLEREDRVGGRIAARTIDGVQVEIGASLFHSSGPRCGCVPLSAGSGRRGPAGRWSSMTVRNDPRPWSSWPPRWG